MRSGRAVLILALIAVALYVGLCVVLVFAQTSLIYYPQPRAALAGVQVFALQVRAVRIEISTIERAGEEAVLYFGGNAEDVAHAVPMLAAAFPARAIYALHYRGYGGSAGRPVEAALVSDALALFEHVRARHARVAVIGRSLGSGVAVQVAAQRPIERLVLVTPFASILGIAQRQFPFLPMRLLLRNRFESARHAPAVTAPTTLVVAERDEIIPRASSDELLAAFPGGVARAIVIPGDHNSIGVEPRYVAALQAGLP